MTGDSGEATATVEDMTSLHRVTEEVSVPVTPLRADPSPPARHGATRVQRVALIGGVLFAVWLTLHLFASILLPFVMAGGIAYFLDPLAGRLERLGLPRGVAAGLLIAAMILLGLLFALLLYPLIVAQLGILLSRLPAYVALVRDIAIDWLGRVQERLGPGFVDAKLQDVVSVQAGSLLTVFGRALSRVIGGGFALFNVLTVLVVTPVVAFYLLRDWPKAVARVDLWLPRRYAGVVRAQAREINRILSAWLRGQALCCLMLGVFYAVGLSFVGLDLGLLLGLATGILSFIPYVGTVLGGAGSFALAMAQFHDWNRVALVAGVFLAGQILENYVIYPRFLGDRVELHAVWVIFALFAGGAAFGFLGVLLAVPMAAVIGVLSRFWLRRYLASPLYLEPPGT
ncbi:putative membrane spanning protein [Granulibacter bethesdensis]|uniref:AI-2E family transporter n=1 Tax=Granulibacter bethesdensis TaxID=364410 RepID=UPI00090A489A|nr:AI-2E family transporter [Granulibacter bethesdensis]APH57861.1 putative membrane spanning protein [Granulibacter bethesdensis]